MKFGKSLSNQIEETLPEWRDKFLSYKYLKKKLKLIAVGGDRSAKRTKTSAGGGYKMTREEEEFWSLEDELEKFNVFFVEKEEEYVIREKELQDLVAMVMMRESKELMKVRKGRKWSFSYNIMFLFGEITGSVFAQD
ncbi:SPX domain-containing protein 1-like [Asparagus officinalis]|uniref:SPX domain-containing protein 1-like n=1 Tax=Asparagus officinalis TaxID=4686 RepID=UPI00098E7C91|nr:SPX domain-containing protein 1-like [Asparagus officinalis]